MDKNVENPYADELLSFAVGNVMFGLSAIEQAIFHPTTDDTTLSWSAREGILLQIQLLKST